jgi:hypothetical protein
MARSVDVHGQQLQRLFQRQSDPRALAQRARGG